MAHYEHIPGIAEQIALKDQVSDAVLKARRDSIWSGYLGDNIAKAISRADQASDEQLRAKKAGEWKNYFAYGGPMSASLHGLGGIPEDIAAEEKKLKGLKAMNIYPIKGMYDKEIKKVEKHIAELKALQSGGPKKTDGSVALDVGSKPFNTKDEAKRLARAKSEAAAREKARLEMLAQLQARADAGLSPAYSGDEGGDGGGMMSGNMPLILGGVALAGAAFWYLKKRK